MKIDANGLYYKDLNEKVRAAVAAGAEKIELNNVNGQYYIGDGINRPVTIVVNGVPGNDLAAFMNGATIVVKENGQDNIGNTMNAGKVIVHGHAGECWDTACAAASSTSSRMWVTVSAFI